MSVRLINRLLKERTVGRKLFVPFITAGDRGLNFTQQAVLALDHAGADAIELGVPFSDPLADGKVIQASSQRALACHTTLARILDMVHTLRAKTNIPILLMGYLNPFLQNNANAMVRRIVQAGVDGTIIPDYPPEEAMDWIKACRKQDLDTIFLTTPNSTPDRLAAVAQASTGYIYYVSVTGTTGARTQLPAHLQQGIARVRSMTPLPILVGFGIATPEQAARVAKVSDGVIVGSALIKTLAGRENNQRALKQFAQLATNIAKAVKK